jgi:TRAP transporter TAXI family solute receptor
MKNMKKSIASMILLSLVLVSSLTVCNGAAAAENSAPAEAVTRYELDVGASNSTGAMFRWNASACDLVNKYNKNIVLSPMATIGSSENAELVNLGECAFGSASSFVSYLAYSGKADWEGRPMENLRVVISMYPDAWECFVAADSGIKSLSDLRGRRISFDAKGTSANVNLLLFKALGYDPEKDFNAFFTNASDSAAAITEGTLDAYITVGGPAVAAFSTLATSHKGLSFINFTEEEQKILCEAFPMVTPTTVDASVWAGNDTFTSIGSSAVILAHRDVPDEVVYAFVRTLQEHHEEHATAAGNAAFATAEFTVSLWGGEEAIPLHPGAKKYYQELGLLF